MNEKTQEHQHSSSDSAMDYEEMLKAGMHYGRKKTVFNPNMKEFIYGTREYIHILDLTKTQAILANIGVFLANAYKEGKLILFVGTTSQSADAVKNAGEKLGMPFVTDRWLGGTLTNFKVITSRVKYLESLEAEQARGDFERLTKKERLLKEREIASLRNKYDGLRRLTRVPDIIFISSLKEGGLPVREAKVVGVQTVAIVNTESNPKDVTFAIPANDNSRKSVSMIVEYLVKSIMAGGQGN